MTRLEGKQHGRSAGRLRRSARAWLVALGLTLSALRPTSASAQQPNDAAWADVEHVFALLTQRLSLMPEVAAAKWRDKLPVQDPERERSLLERTALEAREVGLEPDATRALLSLQMELARARQARCVERWSSGAAQVPPGRDLKSELRPMLDRLGAELLRALALALPELVRAERRERLGQRAAQLVAEQELPADRAPALARALAGLRALPEARLARIRASGVLRVGTTGDYAPFSSDRGGALAGLDIELTTAFAKSLGATVRFVPTSWPTLLTYYARDAFDLAASGISVTPERAQVARFSLGYHAGGKTPIARCAAKQRFDTLAEIDAPGVRVIVNPGGTNEQYVRGALHAAEIRLHPDNRTIFDELVAGRADVMITDDIEAALQARQKPALCRTMRTLLTQADKAWLVQADSALLAQVNAWLGPRVQSGAVAKSLQRQLRAAAR